MSSLKIISADLQPYIQIYKSQGCVRLPDSLDRAVLDLLTNSFKEKFEKRFILDDLSSEYTLTNPLLKTKLNYIFNSPQFLLKMSELTGAQITFTKQRLYYVDQTCVPLPWHDDSYDKDGRIAAIRFELSDAAYEGGAFFFKDEEKVYTFEQFQLGESVLFKVEFGTCFHQVSSVLKGQRKSLVVFLCV